MTQLHILPGLDYVSCELWIVKNHAIYIFSKLAIETTRNTTTKNGLGIKSKVYQFEKGVNKKLCYVFIVFSAKPNLNRF